MKFEELSEREQHLIVELRAGRGVICNCVFDYGIEFERMDDGRTKIFVDPSPIFMGAAIRSWGEEIVSSWQTALDGPGLSAPVFASLNGSFDWPETNA